MRERLLGHDAGEQFQEGEGMKSTDALKELVQAIECNIEGSDHTGPYVKIQYIAEELENARKVRA